MRHLEIYTYWLLASIILTTMDSCSILGSSGSDDGPKLKGIPGQIVYSARQGEERHLFIIDHEGTRQLTSSEGIDSQRDYYASSPSFSTDGKWVVYTSNRGGFGQNILHMVRSDGSGRKPIKDERGNLIVGSNPVFSPDGRQVAFNRPESKEPYYKNEDIYIVNLGSGKVRKLTQNTAHDTNPTWSPDGTKIAFSSYRSHTDSIKNSLQDDIYIINTDGSSLKRITTDEFTSTYVWISSEMLFYSIYKSGTNLKSILSRNIKIENEDSIIRNLEARQLWIFTDLVKKELYLIHKNSDGVSLVLQIFTKDGELLKQKKLNHYVFKSALHFSWNTEVK